MAFFGIDMFCWWHILKRIMEIVETKLALIGCGGIAQRHLQSLKTMGGVRVIATCDVLREKAEAGAGSWHAQAYTDWRTMLDHERPDALLVCTPVSARDGELQEAIDRGIGLFVEKPAAASTQAARELAARAEAGGVVMAVGYMWRYLEALEKAKELLAGRIVGAVRGTAMSQIEPGSWFWDKAKSGGQIYDQTTHLLNAAEVFTGPAQTVFAMGTAGRLHQADYVRTEDVSALSVMYRNGTVGTFVNSWASSPTQFTLELHGADFALTLDLWTDALRGVIDGVSVNYQGANNPYLQEMETFVDAVRAGDPGQLRSPFRCGVETLETTLAANRSLESGRAETVEADR